MSEHRAALSAGQQALVSAATLQAESQTSTKSDSLKVFQMHLKSTHLNIILSSDLLLSLCLILSV